ncbi:DMT family transporter [Siminovitchia terrae]|uniref:DMT family transporter n=1 Tax=Siminovitchia terrae TaxID=1914933 RepID=UPI0028B0B8C8|nr:EamA family transporter [Siminovitchia terrae]
MDKKVFLAFGMTVFIWGSAFPGIKVGLESFSPEHLALLRMLIASAALILFAWNRKMKLPDIKDVPAILFLGFLGFAVYHTGLSFGEQTVSAGVSSLLVSTTPIFSAILGTMFLKDRLSKIGWLGSCMAFLGVALISFGTGNSYSVISSGMIWILIAAFGESFFFVFETNYIKKYGFIQFNIYTIIAGTIFMLFFLPGLLTEFSGASTASTLTVIYLGLIPTIIPYFAIAYVISKTGAAKATSSLYLTPVAALLISWVWLGEIPTILSLIGGIITLVGVGLSAVRASESNDIATKRTANNMT